MRLIEGFCQKISVRRKDNAQIFVWLDQTWDYLNIFVYMLET